jgi:tetratricopeptide (TPR) repeat protein
MKTFLTLFLMMGFVSCGTHQLNRKIPKPEHDLFADESFLRWDKLRLHQGVSAVNLVANCYQSQIDETLEKLKLQISRTRPGHSYWLHVGNCYYQKSDFSKADFYFRLALQGAQGVERILVLNNLALIHFQNQQWERGKALLIESLELAPLAKVPRYNLAQLYLQFGLINQAIANLDHPVFRGATDPEINFALATAWLFRGDLIKSKVYFDLLSESFKLREDVSLVLALWFYKNGDWSQANKIFNQRDRSYVAEFSEMANKFEKLLEAKLK